MLTDIEIAFGMSWFEEEIENHDDDKFIAMLRAYHVESRELKHLYENGYVSQYIYLDMLNRLYDIREKLRQGKEPTEVYQESQQPSFFQRLEDRFLRTIREKPWLSKIMSKYQGMRLTQQLQNNMANMLIYDAVISMLKNQQDLSEDARKSIIKLYKKQRKIRRQGIKMIKVRFPNFYQRNLELLSRRSAINTGWNHIHSQFEHGDLSAKGYISTRDKVSKKLELIKASKPSVSSDEDSLGDMLATLELFAELSDEDQVFLERSSTCITFLPGDVIMGAYETGNAFYVIVQGDAEVTRTDALSYVHRMANLTDGDIMGESALLAEFEKGRHIRSATIIAQTPCTVLHISNRVMLTLLDKYPSLRDRLQQIHDERGADHAPKIEDDY